MQELWWKDALQHCMYVMYMYVYVCMYVYVYVCGKNVALGWTGALNHVSLYLCMCVYVCLCMQKECGMGMDRHAEAQ